MIWAQMAVSFLLWLSVTVWAVRSGMATKLSRVPPSLGLLAVLGGAAVLLGSLSWIVAGKGIAQGRLAIWAWAVVTVGGLIFVAGHKLAAASLVTRAMGKRPRGPERP